ncbi:hypothetical protein AAC387_Pa09g0816 [Persea americana]
MEILESHEKPNVFAHNALISGRDGLGGGNELHGFGDFLGVLDRVDAFAELAEACVDGGRGGAGSGGGGGGCGEAEWVEVGAGGEGIWVGERWFGGDPHC